MITDNGCEYSMNYIQLCPFVTLNIKIPQNVFPSKAHVWISS